MTDNIFYITEDGWLTHKKTGMILNKIPILNKLDQQIFLKIRIKPEDVEGVLEKLKSIKGGEKEKC